MNMTLDEMRTRREALNAQIATLQTRHAGLTRVIRAAESRAWIAANGITPDRVQLSSGEGVPWFGHIGGFAEWLRAQPTPRPYAEWNERIYLTTDVLNGRMPETPGLLEHVQEARP